MKIKSIILLIIIIPGIVSCGDKQQDFEMTVEKVEELKGFILKGIAISGTIKSGCIATGDGMVIRRNAEQEVETTARVLNVRKESETEAVEGQAFQGDYVSLFIPDGKEQDVNVGDVVFSNKVSCITSAGK